MEPIGYSPIDIAYYLRDALLCLGFLAGIIIGVVLMVRRHILAGFLTIFGFAMFALEPLTDFLVFRVLYYQNMSDAAYTALDYVYPCLSTPTIFIGCLALGAALLLLMSERSERKKSSVPDANTTQSAITPGEPPAPAEPPFASG